MRCTRRRRCCTVDRPRTGVPFRIDNRRLRRSGRREPGHRSGRSARPICTRGRKSPGKPDRCSNPSRISSHRRRLRQCSAARFRSGPPFRICRSPGRTGPPVRHREHRMTHKFLSRWMRRKERTHPTRPHRKRGSRANTSHPLDRCRRCSPPRRRRRTRPAALPLRPTIHPRSRVLRCTGPPTHTANPFGKRFPSANRKPSPARARRWSPPPRSDSI